MYLNTNEVACIKAYNYESLPYYHNLATYMKATQSPNIIQFYGFAELEDFPVMVSEWAEFGNLRNIYLRDGITSLKLKLAYTLDVCRAIAYLNALGIYHKELQCSNVLVTAENIAKLKFSSPIRSLSSTFEDVRWRAPEMILNMKLYDQKCEIYSIGMLLWELIFERRPYEDINFSMMIDYVTNGGREKLQFDNNSSIMVNIQKTWSHDPDARMSISKLFIDLDTLIKSLDEDNNKVDNKMSLKLKNPKMAILWYRRAALQNNKDAKEKLEKLGIEFLTRD
uniref:Protein kinase domain-containing protein n=1 Tax=Rhizophagus irregularis (strain DAOM 181602 / DAOM 197198 / MUCL 43194) TaxID=747089 RepID=U9T1H3_RHIID